MKILLNILRWIIYVPLVSFVFFVISLGLNFLAIWVASLHWIWIILFLMAWTGIVYYVLQIFSISIISFVIQIAPHARIGGITLGLIGIYVLIWGVIGVWKGSEGFSWFAALFTLFYTAFWIPLIYLSLMTIRNVSQIHVFRLKAK